MSSWIPGYEVLEGPDRTGVPLRYTGYRQEDGVPAWIRVDAHVPNDLRGAVSLARVYQLTARFEHPELPQVLGYGATTVAGRPFIAYRLAHRRPGPPVAASGLGAEAIEILAELQLLAYEAGTAGLHLPEGELARVPAAERVEGRRLPAREYLAEPRRSEGGSGFSRVLPEAEWLAFTAPELRRAGGRGRVASIRAAVAYRLAAQAHVIAVGRAPEPTSPLSGLASVTSPGEGLPWRLLLSGLDARPDRRPALEAFLSLPASAGNSG